ncbi:carboxyltransferase domain-containing protein [Epibacterium sp. SM1969]|uniref:Carboxyltransferase domain-containing protein n=1 Tax=Tritonibacter aquimaris TaxID=2663379 RepID=A0A844AWV7_9RHOB|nr:allophanate hydrolase subunit 1 [Tritonibacter aquimaris]MQY44377.1 carboxyltransferase domain-containing protein [Tritonibacter aquimaris]
MEREGYVEQVYPSIDTVGLTGMIVTFAAELSEASNRAALALCGAVKQQNWPGVLEVSSTLTSVYVRFDPDGLGHDRLRALLQDLLISQDWSTAALPEGRRLWRVPTVYGTDLAPQLAEVADLAGLSEAAAIEELSQTRVRVLTIGFAPGQPYLGPLDQKWNIPRQEALTAQVPRGALVLSVAQMVLFANPSPTGWRHIGQTGITLFRPDDDPAFLLRPGDELQFPAVNPAELSQLMSRDPHLGGASAEGIVS